MDVRDYYVILVGVGLVKNQGDTMTTPNNDHPTIFITGATVMLTHVIDIVIFDIMPKYPCPFVPDLLPSQPPLQLEFRATADTGVDYCREHFGIEPKVINTR